MPHSWDLFLDDDRYPVVGPDKNWKIARNVDDAMWYIRTYGVPNSMMLDHDLGYNRLSGMDFCKTFANYVIDNDIFIPTSFSYTIHSQNPVGRDNMQSYLDNFYRQYNVDMML